MGRRKLTDYQKQTLEMLDRLKEEVRSSADARYVVESQRPMIEARCMGNPYGYTSQIPAGPIEWTIVLQVEPRVRREKKIPTRPLTKYFAHRFGGVWRYQNGRWSCDDRKRHVTRMWVEDECDGERWWQHYLIDDEGERTPISVP